MTTEEKLKHFQDICTGDAKARSDKLAEDHKKALEASYEEHVNQAKRQAEMQISAETEKLEKEQNRKLSVGELDMKRELGRKQEELKEKLFSELRDRLAEFRKTDEYLNMLDSQVESAVQYAGDEKLTVYLDPDDADKAEQIGEKYKIELKTSETSFGGGTQAELPERHILIDNSFESKIAEARQDFNFDLGGN